MGHFQLQWMGLFRWLLRFRWQCQELRKQLVKLGWMFLYFQFRPLCRMPLEGFLRRWLRWMLEQLREGTRWQLFLRPVQHRFGPWLQLRFLMLVFHFQWMGLPRRL